MQIALALADPVLVEEVSLPLWREAFDALGWPPSLAGKQERLTHEDVLLAFRSDAPSEELFQALETLHDLGTTEGRDAINEFLSDRQIPPGLLPDGLGEREFALRFFLAQRENGILAEVFSKAQVRIQDRNHTRFNDYIGNKAKRIHDPKAKHGALEQVIREYCRQADLGEYVQVRLFDDDDGECRFQIMHSHHVKTAMAITDDSVNSRVKIQYRPIHADFVKYEPSLRRLRITARANKLVEFYRKVFGLIFFEDENFFFGDPVCSLRVLQERRQEALSAHNVFGVGRIWMTDCVWERGDGERLNIHAVDCFKTIEKLNLPFEQGQLIQAKFKIEITGKSARPLIVTVRVPSRVEVKPTHELLANEVLTSIGIRGAHKPSSEVDLWSLDPWRQPLSVWRDCFGKGTDLLVTKGVLKKTQLAFIAPREESGAGRILQVERVSSTEYVGVSDTAEIPSRSLSATDVDGLELAVPALQNHLRGLLQIETAAAPWSDAWFLDLGVMSIGEHQVRAVYALRQPPASAVADIKELTGSVPPVLLLPRGLSEPTGVAEVLLDLPLPSDPARVTRDIIAKTDLASKVTAIHLAPQNARLVVDEIFGKVWFDRIEITGIKPDTQPFRFVAVLARNFPATTNKNDLIAELSPAREDSDQTARSAKTFVNRAIKSALEAQGRTFDDPFPSEKDCYRLTVLAHHRPALP